MTPEEKAVIEWVREWRHTTSVIAGESEPWEMELAGLADALFDSESEPVWTPATLADCMANDRIRIGQEETTVIRATRGIWHVDARDEWRPKAWQHVETRLELGVVPGLQLYPPATPCEILMTPERHAVHVMAQAFVGSTVLDEGNDRA